MKALSRRIAASGSLRRAYPSPREALIGGAFWAAGMGASALLSLWLGGWTAPRNILPIVLLFAAGGALSFAPALWIARLVSGDSRSETRFAAALLAFTAATVAATALIYAVHFRLTFAEEHGDFLSADWAMGLAFSMAAAFYRFAMSGLRLYLPLGLVLLFAAAFWQTRRVR